MLELKDIRKQYGTGESVVHALAGVSLKFRENEFVSILGASGCGKTTMLNIIGGLDRYTSGDLVINGRSTKDFKDSDWDTYRNHSIGFVFQSYNLIPHQTVLANVELALTLSGVSKAERRQRAAEALAKVGLGDQLNKRPNQMSGGQMQRVAIARALVNNPDILLADEPTGALDTTTSVQIMDLLKEVAREKLVIMVTHNPELAEEYSTRIVRLSDGLVVSDTAPYNGEDVVITPIEEAHVEAVKPKKKKERAKKADRKKSMSFGTALSLSFNNLLTKKARTFLTSFAGSIGIIGIALILALSNGVDIFITNVQEETLTSYPISITSQTSNYEAMLSAMVGTDGTSDGDRDPNKIYVDDSISEMVKAMVTMDKNNLAAFKTYFESRQDEFEDDILAVQYSYNMDLQIFNANSKYGDGLIQASPSDILSDFSAENAGLSTITDGISIFSEMLPGKDGELIHESIYEQYELVDGDWPENANEMVIIVDKNNTVSNITLYMLGMLDPDEMTAMMAAMMIGEEYDISTEGIEFSYQDFYDLELFLAYNSDFYEKSNETYDVEGTKLNRWNDKRDEESFDAGTLRSKGVELKIVGVVCPSDDSTAMLTGAIGYTSALTAQVLAKIDDSEIVKQQLAYPSHDVFTGTPFTIDDADALTDAQKVEKLDAYFNELNDVEKKDAYLAIRTEVTDKEMAGYLSKIKEVINTPEARKQFLIDLYGFNSGNGSLEKGTSANTAVAAILMATDMMKDDAAAAVQMGMVQSELVYYQMIVPTFGQMFVLDGVPVTKEANPKVYDTYNGLLETMYDTEEKMERAFDNMTEMTFKSIYAMVETQNLESEILKPTAPHFAAFLAANADLDPQAKANYQKALITKLCTDNGVTSPTDPLTMAFGQYVYSMDDSTLLQKYYLMQLDTDESYKNEAIAALFDEYRANMKLDENVADYAALYENHMPKSESTYDENLVAMGASVSEDSLKAINIYPIDFDAKARLQSIIDDYNAQPGLAEEDRIEYTDMMDLMLSSVSTIIDAITAVLVGFVAISLVVSSIMIGIITYISVLERTKEIGILRSIGASKKDISRVFNAETLIIGFTAGAIGIVVSWLLCIVINVIIVLATGMTDISASLPILAAISLVLISMVLTFIAGLFPSRIAAKKDPVEALRTE